MRSLLVVFLGAAAMSGQVSARGVSCDATRTGDTVVVTITVSKGEIVVSPSECTVRPGTKVLWDRRNDKGFVIDFGEKTPDRAGKIKFRSASVYGHHRAGIVAKRSDKEPFKYSVSANGITVDPAIIIDPARR